MRGDDLRDAPRCELGIGASVGDAAAAQHKDFVAGGQVLALVSHQESRAPCRGRAAWPLQPSSPRQQGSATCCSAEAALQKLNASLFPGHMRR